MCYTVQGGQNYWDGKQNHDQWVVIHIKLITTFFTRSPSWQRGSNILRLIEIQVWQYKRKHNISWFGVRISRPTHCYQHSVNICSNITHDLYIFNCAISTTHQYHVGTVCILSRVHPRRTTRDKTNNAEKKKKLRESLRRYVLESRNLQLRERIPVSTITFSSGGTGDIPAWSEISVIRNLTARINWWKYYFSKAN